MITLLACSPSFAQDAPAAKQEAAMPAGSEKAVKAALAAYPGGVLEDVVTPSQSLGLGARDDTIWTVHTRVDGVRQTLRVSGEGVLIRASKAVQPKDLPTTVASGMARAAPNGADKINKLETLGVVRFVALPVPEIRYGARVVGDAGVVNVTVSADGTLLGTKPTTAPKKAPGIDQNAPTADGPIPEQAAKAVKAMREVFPDMVFELVEEVPYIDSSTQTIVMLWYEVEFFVGGVKHEFNATPDGIVIAYTKTIPVADLPKVAADALAKAVGNGKIEEISKSETRAEPRFVALDDPIVVYEIQPHAGAGAPAEAIKLRLDGMPVKEPELPDWAKASLKKEGRAD